MSESCAYQYHGRIAIRECSDYAEALPDSFQDPFQSVRMNRFQHCCKIFHMFPWTHRACVPIPVDKTALPFRIRKEAPDNSMKSRAFIRHDQFYSGKSMTLMVPESDFSFFCATFSIVFSPRLVLGQNNNQSWKQAFSSL